MLPTSTTYSTRLAVSTHMEVRHFPSLAPAPMRTSLHCSISCKCTRLVSKPHQTSTSHPTLYFFPLRRPNTAPLRCPTNIPLAQHPGPPSSPLARYSLLAFQTQRTAHHPQMAFYYHLIRFVFTSVPFATRTCLYLRNGDPTRDPCSHAPIITPSAKDIAHFNLNTSLNALTSFPSSAHCVG